ncbi:hypothetical protein CDAR_241651 [Caerostris darwini]|uniref:Uncharacterized protein n=1 Tax=Caerostris darwini TaxID=1538125 RepID=A0AAV4WC44_9ARAC|nr:hypothetical protein CDAR_241651 [Caerostris darwini]
MSLSLNVMEAFSSKTERKRNCATAKPLTSCRIWNDNNTTRPVICQTGDALSAPTLLLEQSPLWTLEKTFFFLLLLPRSPWRRVISALGKTPGLSKLPSAPGRCSGGDDRYIRKEVK